MPRLPHTKRKVEPLPRLLRPSPPEYFSQPDIIAELDTERNIVFYRKDIFDQLEKYDQNRVIFMQDKYLTLATTEPSYFSK